MTQAERSAPEGFWNAAVEERTAMKAGIHPVYETRTFHCYGCASEWETRTTLQGSASDGKVHLDICSNCHPFFTGKQKLIDKAGRVERFRKRYEKAETAKK
jgi:large subunit ribosomal protein L31